MPERERISHFRGVTLLSDADAGAMSDQRHHSRRILSSVPSIHSQYRASTTMYTHERDSSVADENFGTETGTMHRFSVSPEVNHTFEEMFETDWEGYIWKQGHIVRSWRHRFAVLSGTCFSYYASKDAALADTEQYRGRVTVTGAERDTNRRFGIVITTTIHKTFCIYTQTQVESDIWIRMITQAVANTTAARSTSPDTHSLTSQKIRQTTDWNSRNLNIVRQFYQIWSTLFTERDLSNPNLSTSLLSLFPYCSTDLVVEIQSEPNFLRADTYHGREGIVDLLFDFTKHIYLKDLILTRCVATKYPSTLQVSLCGTCQNKLSKRSFRFSTQDEIQLSAGGRILKLALRLHSDIDAFQVSDHRRQDKFPCATISKRVLSLSIQHFHVNRVLGKGTFGTVVLATRKNTGEIFAIKILEKESMSNYDKIRTITEMRILRDVHHPFIAPLRFAFQSKSRVFLGMEYYSGGSLYTHMNRFKNNKEQRVKISLDLPRIRFYSAQIVLALCHLHACDIVYRDLKPDNIMLDEDGNIALVDFGLSKANVGCLSGARTMAGSPAYTAPELLKPKRIRDYGKAVDWWCLGILIYEMLFGKRPFHHLNVSVLYKLIEKDRVKFPKTNIPPDVADIILGLLEKDPNKRLGGRHASDILIHPFFKDVRWDLVLKRKVIPPWIPTPICLEEERHRSSEIDFDRYLASRSGPSKNVFRNMFPWKCSTQSRRRTLRGMHDDFDKFSYVSDTTNSFMVDEDEILDLALTGRRSSQFYPISNERKNLNLH